MGSGIVRLLLEKPGLELVGAFGRRSERAGTDVGVTAERGPGGACGGELSRP